MRALTRLLCALGLHRPPPGVDRRWSLRFACVRCLSVVDGGMALPRRR